MHETLHITEKGGHSPQDPQYGIQRARFHHLFAITGGGGRNYIFPEPVNALLIQCRVNTGLATYLLDPNEDFGPENLILNGDFDTDLSHWTPGTGWAWAAPGRAAVTAGVGNGNLIQTVSTIETSHEYHLEVTVTIAAGTNLAIHAGGITVGTIVATGAYTYDFVALTDDEILFNPTDDLTGTVDNVVCNEHNPPEKPILAGENYEIRGYPCKEIRVEASADLELEVTGFILPEYGGAYVYES